MGARGAPRRGRERPRGQPEKRSGSGDASRAATASPVAAARETDSSCGKGGIRGCARHPGRNRREKGEEGAKGEGVHDRQTDSERARAGAREL